MAVSHGKSAALLADEYDLTGYGQYVTLESSVDIHDATVFGVSYKVKATGLKHATLAGDLLWDGATGASHDALADAFGQTTPVIHSFFPQGYAVGSFAALLYTSANRFDVKVVIEDINKCSFGCDASEDGFDVGVGHHALGAETATANGTAVDNAASTANGGVGVLHVTAISGGITITAKIQHSSNNSTWADLITFSGVTAVGAQRTEVVAGTTVNRYTRTIWTISGTGSATFVSAFARR
jgi:hypothetical protein